MKWLAPLLLISFGYVLFGLFLGFQEVSGYLSRIGWMWWLACIGAVLLGHCLLWLRWHVDLRLLGHPLQWKDSLRIYVCGLSLIMAPARGGETLRGIWLRKLHAIPIQIGVGITLSERLLDLASALLILAWGLGEKILPAVMISALIGALGAWLLTHPRAIRWLDQQPLLRLFPCKTPRLHKIFREMLNAMSTLRKLIKPIPLLFGLLMSIGAWMLESVMLLNIFRVIGVNLELTQVASIRTVSSIAGVFSFLPAGIGTSEISSIGLAMFFGSSRAQAFTATLIIRACTVLIPFIIGATLLALNPELYRKHPNERDHFDL